MRDYGYEMSCEDAREDFWHGERRGVHDKYGNLRTQAEVELGRNPFGFKPKQIKPEVMKR